VFGRVRHPATRFGASVSSLSGARRHGGRASARSNPTPYNQGRIKDSGLSGEPHAMQWLVTRTISAWGWWVGGAHDLFSRWTA
jgi:hypothetical protein